MLPKASVVPAVVAPSSPCMASCGTPQSPCNLFAYSNDWAWARLHSAGEVLSLFGCLCQSFLLLSFYVALHKDWTCVEKLSLMHELDAVVQLLWANSRQISPVCEPTGADHSNPFCVHLVLLTFNLMIHNHVQVALCCLFRVLRCSVHVAFLDFFRKNLDPLWPFERPRPRWHQPQSQAPEFVNGVALLESDGIRWFVLSLVMS